MEAGCSYSYEVKGSRSPMLRIRDTNLGSATIGDLRRLPVVARRPNRIAMGRSDR
jgi:hypothetical protein